MKPLLLSNICPHQHLWMDISNDMYILTFCSLCDVWSQLFEHLCLFLTLPAAQRSDPTLGLTCSPLLTPRGSPLAASPNPPCKDTPSPILLLSNAHSTVSSKGNLEPSSFSTAEKKHSSSRTRSIQSAPSLPSQTPIGQIPTSSSAAEVKVLKPYVSLVFLCRFCVIG